MGVGSQRADASTIDQRRRRSGDRGSRARCPPSLFSSIALVWSTDGLVSGQQSAPLNRNQGGLGPWHSACSSLTPRRCSARIQLVVTNTDSVPTGVDLPQKSKGSTLALRPHIGAHQIADQKQARPDVHKARTMIFHPRDLVT
jgi:hypothetical protein